MANTYTLFLFHFVFATKGRIPVITADRKRDLYAYFFGINENLDAHTYRIGGVEDHVHILASLPSSLAPATYLSKVKSGSTNWIRDNDVFTNWPGWQGGYGGFTESWKEKERLMRYIAGQEEHHAKEDFLTEYRRMLEDAGIEFEEQYL